jgi:hypothetical protein
MIRCPRAVQPRWRTCSTNCAPSRAVRCRHRQLSSKRFSPANLGPHPRQIDSAGAARPSPGPSLSGRLAQVCPALRPQPTTAPRRPLPWLRPRARQPRLCAHRHRPKVPRRCQRQSDPDAPGRLQLPEPCPPRLRKSSTRTAQHSQPARPASERPPARNRPTNGAKPSRPRQRIGRARAIPGADGLYLGVGQPGQRIPTPTRARATPNGSKPPSSGSRSSTNEKSGRKSA